MLCPFKMYFGVRDKKAQVPNTGLTLPAGVQVWTCDPKIPG